MLEFINRVLFITIILVPGYLSAKMPDASGAPVAIQAGVTPPPSPPVDNPHPPITELDKHRVAFGLLAAETLLTQSPSANQIDSKINLGNQDLRFHVDEACLKNEKCWSKNHDLSIYLKSIKSGSLSPFSHFQHAHLIPWALQKFDANQHQKSSPLSTPGLPNPEYKKTNIIGSKPLDPMDSTPTKQQSDEYIVHVYAQNSSGVWYHVDVMVSEDKEGVMRFERFYLLPMPWPHQDMPIGVSC